MKIGLAYDLKATVSVGITAPDDSLEEYDSGATVEFIAATIEAAGHEVVRLGGGREFLANVLHEKVDLVFNIAEGRGTYRSREAQVPAVLEMLDIPYSGADPQCLAVCLDKHLTKKLVAREGILTPRWLTINDREDLYRMPEDAISFPVIIKPAFEGSSKGIRLSSLVRDPAELPGEVNRLLDIYRQPVMAEEFITGDEVTVGVTGNAPPLIVGIMGIVPRKKEGDFIYSLEVKRDYLNLVDYECPARLPETVLEEIRQASLKVFNVLGCRDFARLDFRVSAGGLPYFLEINPLPGLGTYSDLVIMTQLLGRTHRGLVTDVLEAALKRYPQCVPA
ncbi:MAG: D-alanine--D-alanine ligase [Chloroflexota bacterium]